jgi:hypothetical protein
VGPDGGQGGSGYDVDASLTVCGASDERTLPALLKVGIDGWCRQRDGMNRLSRGGTLFQCQDEKSVRCRVSL